MTGALKKYFDPKVNQLSPICDDYVRVVKHDEKEAEHVTYEKFDSASYQQSLGPVDNWSMTNLMKAGINPDFPVKTGYVSRIEGTDTLLKANDYVETMMKENEETTKEE